MRDVYAKIEQVAFAEVIALYVGASSSQRGVVSNYVAEQTKAYDGLPLVLLKKFPDILTDAYSEAARIKFKVQAKIVVDALTGVATHDVAASGSWYMGALAKYASFLMPPHVDEVALSFVYMAETDSQPTVVPTSSQCAGCHMVISPAFVAVLVVNQESGATEAAFKDGVALSRTNDWIHARKEDANQAIYVPLGTTYQLIFTSDTAFDAVTCVEEYLYHYLNNNATRKERSAHPQRAGGSEAHGPAARRG